MLKFAFIGLGQYGGRQVEEFMKESNQYIGMAVNTALNDLAGLVRVPESNRLQLKGHTFGAGRTPEIAYEAILQPENAVAFRDMMLRVTEDADFIWLVAGLGGGTGTGVLQALLENAMGIFPKPVGLIVTLPRDEDGPVQKHNALRALHQISAAIENNEVGAVFVVDNDHFCKTYTDQDRKADWRDLSNQQVSRTLHQLNQITMRVGTANVDRKDMEKLFTTPGCLAIGRTTFKRLDIEDVYQDIKASIIDGYFTTGYRLNEALYYALCFTLNEEGEKTIRTSTYETHLVKNLSSLFNRALDNFFGYYSGEKNSVITVACGLGLPNRVEEIQKQVEGYRPPERKSFTASSLPNLGAFNSLLNKPKPTAPKHNAFFGEVAATDAPKSNPFEEFLKNNNKKPF